MTNLESLAFTIRFRKEQLKKYQDLVVELQLKIDSNTAPNRNSYCSRKDWSSATKKWLDSYIAPIKDAKSWVTFYENKIPQAIQEYNQELFKNQIM
jgi:hypothetical protein